jgi:hypothetical protein
MYKILAMADDGGGVQKHKKRKGEKKEISK